MIWEDLGRENCGENMLYEIFFSNKEKDSLIISKINIIGQWWPMSFMAALIEHR